MIWSQARRKAREKETPNNNNPNNNDLGTGKEKNIMKIIVDIEPSNYDFFWSGARDTVKEMTTSQIETVFNMLEELYPEGMTDTQLNDFFWFEDDTIAEWLGFDSFEDLMEANAEEGA